MKYVKKEVESKLTLEDIVLISDIHANVSGIHRAVKYAREKNKTVILMGDIFDRGDNLEHVIDIIHNNLDIITVLLGNHDDMFYHAFGIWSDKDELKSDISHMVHSFIANDHGEKTLSAVTKNSEKFDSSLLHSKDFVKVIKNENSDIFNKIEDIKNHTQLYVTLIDKPSGYEFRFSHTGNIILDTVLAPGGGDKVQCLYNQDTLWETVPSKSLIKKRKENSTIDFCGHVVIPFLEKNLKKQGIDFFNLFTTGGNAVFVPSWNAVYIDNGKGSNVIKNTDVICDKIKRLQGCM